MARISAPLFAFGDGGPVKQMDDHVEAQARGGELALSGPSALPDGRTLPLRGDLAHIRLAGVHFVPHYAVPMPRFAGTDGATVRSREDETAEVLAVLRPGSRFDVLDMAGDWAWGEVEGDGGEGPVGFVLLAEIGGAGE